MALMFASKPRIIRILNIIYFTEIRCIIYSINYKSYNNIILSLFVENTIFKIYIAGWFSNASISSRLALKRTLHPEVKIVNYTLPFTT